MPPKQSPQMHLSEHRLASFSAITKPKTKARPAWPLNPETHPLLTPENMVGAGFYYKPGEGEDGDDTCVCFTCGVSLGGWAEDDDPYKEHAVRGECAWAETICQVKVDRDSGLIREYTTPEDLPSSATYSQIRENTYYSKDKATCYWPHIKNKKHQVTPQSLAKAGFVFTPSGPSSDLVKCPYCEYDVEEWDEDDDPMEQHRRKRPTCLFFTAQVTKGKPKRAPRITKKTKPTEIEAELESEIEAIPSTSRRTRNQTSEEPSQSQSQPPKTKTRPKRGKKAEDVIEVDEDPEVEVEDSQTKSGSTRGGRNANREAVVDEMKESRPQSPVQEVETESIPVPVTKSKSKSTTSSRSTIASGSGSTSTLKESSSSGPSKSTATTKKSKSSRKAVPAEDEELSAPVNIEVEEPATEVVNKPKAKPRTTKASKSKSKGKTVSEEVVGPEEVIPAPTTTTTTTKSVKPLPPLPPPSPAPLGRPLSQLDRFANIPPSSPLSAPLPNRITKPIPKKINSQPNRPIQPIDKIPSESGKKVVKEVISSIIQQLPLPIQEAGLSKDRVLSEEQLNMTMEGWIKAEMKLKREEIEREGREMIDSFQRRTEEARRKIEGLPTW